MRYTMRHHFAFPAGRFAGRSLLSADAWSQVRLAPVPVDDGFHLPADRAEWQALCQQAMDYQARAHDLARLIVYRGYRGVCSIGVGRACLEYHLKSALPAVSLTCTEYSRDVVDRLRTVFPECDALAVFDLNGNDWPFRAPETLVLLHRVDTELTDAEWRGVFQRLATAGGPDVLLIAGQLLTPRAVFSEARRRLQARLCGRSVTFAGYMRTRAQFADLWFPHYRLAGGPSRLGGLPSFLLTRH